MLDTQIVFPNFPPNTKLSCHCCSFPHINIVPTCVYICAHKIKLIIYHLHYLRKNLGQIFGEHSITLQRYIRVIYCE